MQCLRLHAQTRLVLFSVDRPSERSIHTAAILKLTRDWRLIQPDQHIVPYMLKRWSADLIDKLVCYLYLTDIGGVTRPHRAHKTICKQRNRDFVEKIKMKLSHGPLCSTDRGYTASVTFPWIPAVAVVGVPDRRFYDFAPIDVNVTDFSKTTSQRMMSTRFSLGPVGLKHRENS